MRHLLFVSACLSVVACGHKDASKDQPAAGSATAQGSAKPAPPPAPAKPAVTFSATAADGTTKLGPFNIDHQIVTDDGNGNHMLMLIAKCPQITDSCSIAKYLRENTDLLNEKCPGWAEVSVSFSPKDQKAGMGPLVIAPGKYTSKMELPIHVGQVQYTEKDSSKEIDVNNDEQPLVEVTKSDATGMAGTITAKGQWTKGAVAASFDAKMCTCDQSTGACK